jgi:hypothetical protein
MLPATFGIFFTTDPNAIEYQTFLPDLHTISSLENSEPGKALLRALAAQGITLIDEETATLGKKT